MDRNSTEQYSSNQIIVRDASAEDAQAIMHIWNANISSTLNTFNSRIKTEAEIKDTILETNEKNYGFFVSEREGSIIGFATYFQFRAGVGYAKTLEHTIVISDHMQRYGVGKALMGRLLEDAKRKNFQSIFAGVSGSNERAVNFHASLGFQIVAELPRVGYKFDKWLDLILMQKFLQTDRRDDF